MRRWDKTTIEALADDVCIGDNVCIECDTLTIGQGARIGHDVTIKAAHFSLGAGSIIEERCRIGALGGAAQHIAIGDETLLAHDSKILLPVALIGDYASIHNHALINGLEPFLLGHNSWVGEHCVLNANKRLEIGNHVGIGAYSSIYTHGFFGDLLQGCQINKEAPVTLKDDVWILGAYNIISPGVTLGEKALVLTGSNVTRDVPDNHTVGGAPAKDMTDKLVPFVTPSIEAQCEMMRRFLHEFAQSHYADRHELQEDGTLILSSNAGRILLCCMPTCPHSHADYNLHFTPDALPETLPDNTSVFSISQRSYTKKRHPVEIEIIRFLRNPRARFVPQNQPRINWPVAPKREE